MTEFQCLRCTGKIEASNLVEAIKNMDHALGLSKGRPCAGGKHAPIQEVKANVRVETVKVETKTETKVDTKKKSNKSD